MRLILDIIEKGHFACITLSSGNVICSKTSRNGISSLLVAEQIMKKGRRMEKFGGIELQDFYFSLI